MYSDGARSIPDVIQTGYSVDIGKYLGEGWEIFKKNIGGFIGFTAIIFLVSALAAILPEKARPLGNIASAVLAGPLNAGMFIVAFKLIKQRSTTFSDFFLGFNNFLQFFIANLLMGILVILASFVFVLPGIYLGVAYSFTTALIVDRKFDFWEAMETSRKVITKRWFSFFGFVLVLALINIVGFLLLGVGVLVTAPLTMCAIAAAYQDILGLSATSMIEDAV
jgi:uncharacterized membrane protein